MAQLEESSVDAIVCDPPYGLEFMGKEWDRLGGSKRRESKPGIGERSIGWVSNRGWNTMRCRSCGRLSHGGSPCSCEKPDFGPADDRMQQMQIWHHRWAREALQVLKPGGHLLAFGGTRTSHRLACAIEDAGFEIRDSIMWIYGSGFPKSLDVSKAIDKAERGVPQGGADPTSPNHGRFKTQATEGKRSESDKGQGFGAGPGAFMAEEGEVEDREIVNAAQPEPWQGWGTALKPAHEPIVVARKPLIGTVATNVLEHGTGGINVDACRLGTDDQHKAKWESAAGNPSNATGDVYGEYASPRGNSWTPLGRWPANVVLSHTEGCELLGSKKVKKAGTRAGVSSDNAGEHGTGDGATYLAQKPSGAHYGDPDGTETVEAWECAPGCPVAALDAQ